jgi:hypothetical protein
VDILLIIDDSSSMAPAQAKLAEAVPSLLAPLEAAGVNYRIAITTTDNGNPRCAKGSTTPTEGSLVLSSCIDRVFDGEFLYDGVDGSFACTDYCSLTGTDLKIKPTTTEFDPVPKPHPWIEFDGQSSNAPDGVSPEQALQCFLPQGILGCDFASPLESLFRAVQRWGDPSDKSYGFLRAQAHFVAIIVGDTTDCSVVGLYDEIFIDNKTFWNSPDDVIPTAAVCWRAGVSCSGGGPVFIECHAENFDIAGQPSVGDTAAVLQPLSRYTKLLQSIRDEKDSNGVSGPSARVFLINGVPPGYSHGDPLTFSIAGDSAYLEMYGIDAGCSNGSIAATPPVRELEVAASFVGDGSSPAFSICDASFDSSLSVIAADIISSLPD